MKCKQIFYFMLISLSLLLYGCAKDLPPGSYDSTEVGKLKKVIPGVIISKRPIHIYTKKADVAFTENFSATDENPQIDTGAKRTKGYEYVIKLHNGDIVSIAQQEDLKLKIKQHVLVIYGSTTRIVPDEGSGDN